MPCESMAPLDEAGRAARVLQGGEVVHVGGGSVRRSAGRRHGLPALPTPRRFGSGGHSPTPEPSGRASAISALALQLQRREQVQREAQVLGDGGHDRSRVTGRRSRIGSSDPVREEEVHGDGERGSPHPFHWCSISRPT